MSAAHCRLMHYGPVNSSGEYRPVLYTVYAAPWFVGETMVLIFPATVLSLPCLWGLTMGLDLRCSDNNNFPEESLWEDERVSDAPS